MDSFVDIWSCRQAVSSVSVLVGTTGLAEQASGPFPTTTISHGSPVRALPIAEGTLLAVCCLAC